MTESTPLLDADPFAPPIDWALALAQHERWLRTVIFARVGERQAVDEVLQELSLAAVADRAPLRDTAKLAPWLYRIAVTQALLYRRKRGRQRKLEDRFATQVAPTQPERGAADPLHWLIADERRRLIREAIGALPRRDAEILLLKYTEDWSYRQLAERLGISESAVEARLHRARARMRDLLTARQVVDSPSA